MKKIFIVVCGLWFFSCKNNPLQEETVKTQADSSVVTLTDAQYKNAGIETGALQQKPVSVLLKLNGKIDVPPQNMVSVSVPMGGYLKYTKLLPGMHIQKGETLAVVEDPQYIQLQQDYLIAKSQLALNEIEYNRQKDLNESKATSDKVFEQARAAYQTQNILAKSLAQKLRLIGLNPESLTPNNISKSINIYSPISGFVSSVNVNTGKYVNPSDVLFELVNPDDIHLGLTVFDKDVNKLSIGQKVIAYSNAHPEKKYTCKIILISKNVSSENATQVHCHFEQFDKSLLPGMFMNAEVEISNDNATVLPDDAIVRYENKQYIFTLKEKSKFKMQEVQVGASENGYTEILDSGKLNNVSVAVKGAYSLLMALKNTSED
ncbi:MAG: efflux RND transporter periplasmic adaptor subunit [Chitinophagaceae bacterium]|jgi:cobalt-zinc-cadmium efflux system membrane fusion protein|nr:efflux RND transporter periplasmic adaptor subunit [Chitinophagaceae bacterium]